MFTWICPKCGREVPPSYNECPDCAANHTVVQQPPLPQQPLPVAPRASAQAPAQSAPSRSSLPGWLLAVLFAIAFSLFGAGGYFAYRRFSGPKENPNVVTSFDPPAKASGAPAVLSSLTKYIEVTGVRLAEDAQQTLQVQFLVVNHSGGEIADLTGAVQLKPKTGKQDEKPLASFEFKVASLGPYQSQEVKATAKTSLRAYELPDWQFLETDVEILSPK